MGEGLREWPDSKGAAGKKNSGGSFLSFWGISGGAGQIFRRRKEWEDAEDAEGSGRDMREIYFWQAEGAWVCEIPRLDDREMEAAEETARHTKNTWQKKRGFREILKNTVQGKTAEAVFEACLEQIAGVSLSVYDQFRTDGMKNHAPVDALIFQKETAEAVRRDCERRLAEAAAGSGSGVIPVKLREYLSSHGAVTVEIKSSVLKGRDLAGVSHSCRRTKEDFSVIAANILERDFFVYPHFLRSSEEIGSFYQYAEYVRTLRGDEFPAGNRAFLHRLMREEYDNACDVYTRLYFDYEGGHVYVPGYVSREDFFAWPEIGKMPGQKSGGAVYYMRSIGDRHPVEEIGRDPRLWNRDRQAAWERLFCGHEMVCPICGGVLQVCGSRKHEQYYLRCFDCRRNFSMDREYVLRKTDEKGNRRNGR